MFFNPPSTNNQLWKIPPQGVIRPPVAAVLHFVPPNLPGVGSPNGETQPGQYVAGNGGPQSRAEQALAGMSVTSKRPESREASADRMKSKMEALPSAGSLTGSSPLSKPMET